MKGVYKLQKHRERFDRWAPTYEKGLLWKRFFLPLHEALIERLPQVDNLRIVDIGCGTGALDMRLWEMGARVTGLDLSQRMLEIARARAEGKEGLEFFQATAEDIPLEDGWADLALSTIAFHHFPHPGRALREIHRVMKPESPFFLCDMCNEGVLGRATLRYGKIVGTDDRHYSRREMTSLLKRYGFAVEEATLLRKIPPVMLVIARK